jgi:hypothetical protein
VEVEASVASTVGVAGMIVGVAGITVLAIRVSLGVAGSLAGPHALSMKRINRLILAMSLEFPFNVNLATRSFMDGMSFLLSGYNAHL